MERRDTTVAAKPPTALTMIDRRTVPTSTSGFDDFYATHRADAVRWAIALVGDRGVAEEIAQDSFAAMGRRWDDVDDPPAYLRRTITNRSASWHRSLGRERRRVRRATAGQPSAYTAETNEMLDSLAALPYQQRAAVSLRYWADWTDAQIAEALGCAPTTVRVLLHRGLTALRKEIER